jgi:hypothetical protein
MGDNEFSTISPVFRHANESGKGKVGGSALLGAHNPFQSMHGKKRFCFV